MANLSTKYMGIELKNPIIVGASNLVNDPENLKRMEEAGASAIVYKSLFEEQIQLESLQFDEEMASFNNRNAEMMQLYPGMKHAGPKEYLMKLKKAKESVSIPVFASLNAVFEDTWVEYAKLIEETGVDGIELNFYATPKNTELLGEDIVDQQLNILQKISKTVKIPVSVKLSPYYANPLNVITRMDKTGVKGVVLFNRLFQPDIDIDTERHEFTWNLSHEGDHRLSLRFSGLLYGNVDADVCSNSGIYSGKDVIQLLLAGTECVQVVSSLYKNKIEHLSIMLKDLENWMDSKGYGRINDFRGKLAKNNLKDPFAYKRAQYVDILLNGEEIFKRHAV